MEMINRTSLKQKIQLYKKHKGSLVVNLLVKLAALITFLILIYLIVYILINGVQHINVELFSLKYTSDNVSVLPSIINTLIIIIIALVLSVPIGVFTAIFLVEYARKGSGIVNLIRLTAETLSGIPSIVYGLFGMLFFGITLGLGYSLLGGGLTLAIMILPTVIRTTEEALLSVPDSYREGSFGLGAGRVRTVFRIILPSAMPGILSGIILSIGRIIGESAALIYTAGTVTNLANSMFNSGRTLAVHMYILASEGLYTDQAYATAVVLLVIAVIINLSSQVLSKKIIQN